MNEEGLVKAIHLVSVDMASIKDLIDSLVGKYRKIEWGKLDSVMGGCELHVRIESEAGIGWLPDPKPQEYRKD